MLQQRKPYWIIAIERVPLESKAEGDWRGSVDFFDEAC